MVICLEQGANDLHMVQLMPLPPHHLFIEIQVGFTSVVPAYTGCPGKKAIKQLGCLSVCQEQQHWCIMESNTILLSKKNFFNSGVVLVMHVFVCVCVEQKCGNVLSWKRVQGASGKLQGL